MLIGATLGGAVHDSVILFCSVRRGGKSLGQMVKDEVGPFAGLVSLVAIVSIMVILLAVLGLVVVKALANSPWGFFTIAMTLPISVAIGIAMQATGFKPRGLVVISAAGVIALLASVWAGSYIPGSRLEAWFSVAPLPLAWILIAYGFAASILPIWLILTPRDYLSTFLKIGTIAALAAAIVVLAPRLQMPALTRFIDGTGPVFAGPVFPFCFITIACAAVSGFHATIASGTTPKLLARESDIRPVAYGAMLTEMCVGVMALIAACSLRPGEYFAINAPGAPAAVVAHISSLGFPVAGSDMARLAREMGEKTMFGRTGGAPTFAAGMAQIFNRAFHAGGPALGLWYHFAIMFEALFILTTLDAGTRVGRFLVQDFLALAWKPLGRTGSWGANLLATSLFVGAWGWFLYQGVVDPLGGINSLWPIFGIANQLLAVIALAFGTTILIKMGKTRYTWATLLPLAWLFAVTMTAGWMKIFSPSPALGFLSAADAVRLKLAAAGGAGAPAALHRQIANLQIDAAVTAFYLILVLTVVASNAYVWWQLLAGRRASDLREDPYLAADPA
jgi:carbon starvation protein